ncbi:MAG: penicillin-binding protein 1A [Gammaproteobacteria bacterium]|nr:penicillin-binding protein 1A [Gammaproteobacteria bacterium]
MRHLYQFFLTLFTLFVSTFLFSVIAITSAYFYFDPKLPKIDVLKNVQLQVPLRVYSSDNKLLAEFGEIKREPIHFHEIPKTLINAVISAEDESFFFHPGIDYKGILRAMVHLAKTGKKGQGGSTITMQVARNFFLTPNKTYIRKIKEIFLSLKIEKQLSKQEIMALYMNKIYLGHRSYGVAAASKVYYGKELKDLSLEQYAMIAGLPKAPSKFNPITNSKRATIRRNYVLSRMKKLNYISQENYNLAIKTVDNAKIHVAKIELEAPYIAEMVRAKMVKDYDKKAYSAGYNVYTSISSEMQETANKSLRKALMDYEHRHGYKGVLAHYNLTNIPTLEQKIKLLSQYKPMGPLKPALITHISKAIKKKKHIQQHAVLLLKDGTRAALNWTDVKWAKKYINDFKTGSKPKKIEDVIKMGDVIYVEKRDDSNYALAQIPEASGAFVSLNPQNGAINALMGGFDYYHSKFNRAVQAKRQPGSNFKPFIYSAALNKGYTAATLINDAPVVFKDSYLEGFWRPNNYSGKFFGPTRLRKGLIKSRNLVSIRILRDIGIHYTIDYVKRFGFTEEELPKNLSLALGSATLTPMQIARGYAILANGGYDVSPWFIERIEDPKKNIIFQQQHTAVCNADYPQKDCPKDKNLHAKRIINEENVFLMTTIMRDVIRFGTATKALKLGRKDLAGKTGTTNDQLDAWFSGFNRQITATAWVGFDTPRSLGRVEFGSTAALPMWIDFMKVALKDKPEQKLRKPDNIITVKIDSNTGLLASRHSKKTQFEFFVNGTEPQGSNNSDFGSPSERRIENTEVINEELF